MGPQRGVDSAPAAGGAAASSGAGPRADRVPSLYIGEAEDYTGASGMMEAVACGQHTTLNNNNKYGWQQQQQQQQQQQISDKFRQLCEARPGGEAGAMRSRADSLTLGRPEVRRPGAGGGYSHGTLPRGLGDTRDHRLSVSSHNLADVERLYMAMKNLSSPLPGARLAAEGAAMPAVAAVAGRGASMESLVCSVMGDIPPPPPPLLMDHLSPAPASPRRPAPAPAWSPHKSPGLGLALPPLPPKRSSSRVAELGRPANLNLAPDTAASIYSRPRLETGHRTSLMSTGSSDSGTGSTSDQDQPLLSPASGQFSWPGPGPRAGCDNQSVYSEAASVANTSMTSHSGLYVKMRHPSRPQQQPVFSGEGAEYMNLLYSAVAAQGGGGSVEAAMSPYLAMTAPAPAPQHYTPVSAIYDQIQSRAESCEQLREAGRGQQQHGSRALEQFRQLMVEVERKRQFRVGLNLFNSLPDVGVDYLVKLNFIELSPLSVAKFLYKNQSLSKLKIGEYLGQHESAFCAKVLSLFVQEFDLAGLRLDKAVRRLLALVQMPAQADRVEKIMETFVKRFIKCNPGSGAAGGPDTLVTLAAAIVQLSRELHPGPGNQRPARKVSEKDFVSRLSCGAAEAVDPRLSKAVYKSVKKRPVTSEADHVSQAAALEASLATPAPASLAAPHRRLVCLCRVYTVRNINTESEAEARSRPRTAWLFNDLLVLVKGSGKGASVYKESFPLLGLEVSLFRAGAHRFGVQVVRKKGREILVSLSLDTEQDQYKFVMDLQESVFEMEAMHRAAREANMAKQ